MEHPLIQNIDSLTLDELQDRIRDLNRKLSWAMRSNRDLAGQISMALETYNNKYREKQQAIYDEARKNAPDFGDKIDIS